MTRFLGPIAFRYLAAGVQLVIVVMVARQSSPSVAGTYFSIFGAVAVFHVLAGFGIPDGMVAQIPIVTSAALRALFWRALIWSLCSSAVMVSVGVGALMMLGANLGLAILSCVWLLCYGAVFIFGQFFVALGKVTLGAFFAYSSINLVYLLTIAPYIMLSPKVTLLGLLAAGAGGALIASLVAGVTLLALTRKVLQRDREKWRDRKDVSVRSAISVGLPITASRLLQASIPWIPVWVLASIGNHESAATYAAASRLIVALTASLGAIRFSVRPRVVETFHRGDRQGLARLSRKVSAYTLGATGVAIIFVILSGDWVFVSLLGTSYAGVSSTFLILLLGVLGEGFGGISDEILKMTNSALIALLTLLGAVAVQLIISWIVKGYGPGALAWGAVLAFWTQYALQIVWLDRKAHIRIWRSAWA